jgi:hypothetical protein
MRYLHLSLSERRSNFFSGDCLPARFRLPSAWPSVSLLFGFLVTEFTVVEITFICVPRPLGNPSRYRWMKLASASCFASSPLSQVLLFREELRLGVTSPPDHVPDSRTAIAIQLPPPLSFSIDYLSMFGGRRSLAVELTLSRDPVTGYCFNVWSAHC